MNYIFMTDQSEFLLLSYGGSFFNADDTEESDYDILMVVKLSDMEAFMQSEFGGKRGTYEIN